MSLWLYSFRFERNQNFICVWIIRLNEGSRPISASNFGIRGSPENPHTSYRYCAKELGYFSLATCRLPPSKVVIWDFVFKNMRNALIPMKKMISWFFRFSVFEIWSISYSKFLENRLQWHHKWSKFDEKFIFAPILLAAWSKCVSTDSKKI